MVDRTSSPEVRLVRYAALGALPAVAMLSVSSSGEVTHDAVAPSVEKPAYAGGLETEGYFTTFGAPVDMSTANVLSTVVIPVTDAESTGGVFSGRTQTDWSRPAALAEGATGIRASRSA
jgi:hypothetical protein